MACIACERAVRDLENILNYIQAGAPFSQIETDFIDNLAKYNKHVFNHGINTSNPKFSDYLRLEGIILDWLINNNSSTGFINVVP